MNTRIILLKNCSNVFGCVVFVVPFFVLLGWLTDNEILKHLVIGSAPMNPITGSLFILSAGSLLFSSSHLRTFMLPVTGLVLLVSLYQITQFRFDLSYVSDEPFFSKVFGVQHSINPMAPTAAVGFALLSLSNLFGFSKRTAFIQQTIVIIVLIGAVFMVTGYTLHVPEFHSSIHLFPALQTCILFLILSVSILLSQPDEGIIKLLIVDLEGSRIGRLLLPVTIAIPFGITYFRFLAQRLGWITTELGIALVLLSYVIILTSSLFMTILSLNSRDQARNDFITKINNLIIELKEMHNQLLASNEELAASNEEIKTANEELSTMNEQLSLAIETIRAQDLIIIEQKEEALKRSQQHLEIIFSNTKEEILLMDSEGRLVIFNSALENFITKATGNKPRVGMYVWDITTPSRREESKRLFQEALHGNAVTTEAIVTTPSGEVTHFLKYEPVVLDGKVSFVTLISVDITERKLAEEKLKRQFEELEKTNYELDHFVYSVSHDLRAPLSSILGLINVAEMDNGDKSHFLGMMRGRVNHLDGFIKDILDYSHNARSEFLIKKIDFSQLLEDVKFNLKLIDGFDRLNLRMELDERFPFYSDHNRLSIILNNIVSNSIKFQDYAKSDSTLGIFITTKDDRVEIIATDNGVGIEASHLDKVFNMFYRASLVSKGSGLGLYLVKEAVSKLGGTIRVQSIYTVGTTFEIVLPIINVA